MSVKLRLQRKGRTKAPFYHIVVADARAPRDGRFIEKIGTYNPLTVPATIELNRDRAYEWLKNGAQPTDTVRAILRFKGVMLRKHLDRGVKKGALTTEQADAELAKWIEAKEAGIQKRREATTDAKKKFIAAVDGTAKVKAKPVVVEEAAPVAEEAEATAPVEETVVAEVTAPVEEAVVETPVAEAPAEVEAAPEAEAAAPVSEETAAEPEKTEEA
jgi:small subunit ribosomal protein S16